MLSKFLFRIFSPHSLVEQLSRQKNYTLHNIDIALYDVNAMNKSGQNALLFIMSQEATAVINYNKLREILYKSNIKKIDKNNCSILFYAINSSIIFQEKEIDYLIANTDLNEIYSNNSKNNLYLHLRNNPSFYDRLSETQKDNLFYNCDLFYKNAENISAAQYILCEEDISSKYFSHVVKMVFNKDSSIELMAHLIEAMALKAMDNVTLYNFKNVTGKTLIKMDKRLLAIWNLAQDKSRLMKILTALVLEEHPDFQIIREREKLGQIINSGEVKARSFKL